MSYSVWMDGTKLGDTSLEISHGTDRRAGVFHPTAPGLAVLPGISAMGPALLEAGRMCREAGMDTDDPDLDIASAAGKAFETSAGPRILEAAKLLARVELRGPDGRPVPWESLLISDLNELAEVAGYASTARLKSVVRTGAGDPIRYFISTKLSERRPAGVGTGRDRPRH